jgi:integrase/recombinase XerC
MTDGPLQGGVQRYLASLRNERRLSAHTASNYARDLASLVDYCTTQGLASWAQVDAQHMRMFAAREHRQGLAPRSIQRRLSACRGLFRYLLREGELRRDPTGDVQAPKSRKRLPTPLDADSRSATRRSWSCCIRRGCGLQNCSTCSWRTSTCVTGPSA